MAWVVDSCLLLDVALRDPVFGLSSALLLDELRADGLVACPVSVVEVAPQFGGHVRNVEGFLELLGAAPSAAWLPLDTEHAAAGWVSYVRQKRLGSAPRRPVADLLIGGFACRFQGLATRNPQDFRPFFPNLPLRQPKPS
jgi:predicted nucleic acid-binding protein